MIISVFNYINIISVVYKIIYFQEMETEIASMQREYWNLVLSYFPRYDNTNVVLRWTS